MLCTFSPHYKKKKPDLNSKVISFTQIELIKYSRDMGNNHIFFFLYNNMGCLNLDSPPPKKKQHVQKSFRNPPINGTKYKIKKREEGTLRFPGFL